ncbi:NUDIX hydrolase [Hyphomicrobium sp.]|jgi:8-oxo-dGTP diphosphatase|uniref:NUDIX hydrolase n=1 Tax=Hyphomicrobium sp. TaxID=82 RepID=UPI002C127373|nr:NUDIX hydrolase [Hyphomicrobium sp.]HVZ03326.1 NUDIX hydrolase [Hyphomicrobium sp.]
MPIPKTPLLAVDCVIFDPSNRILLIRRKNEPFINELALPGGFVEIGETVEDACRREIREETAINLGPLSLIGVYSDPSRDPRGHSCSVAFAARTTTTTCTAGDDAAEANWFTDYKDLVLAFDHRKILDDAQRLMPTLK